MFQFIGEGKDGNLLCVVMEPTDMTALFAGQMVLAKPKLPPGTSFTAACVMATAQPRDVFLAEMQKAGSPLGTVLHDHREQKGTFAVPYEQGVAARIEADKSKPVPRGIGHMLCPYKSGPWREHWILGWNSEDTKRKNQEELRHTNVYYAGRNARIKGVRRTDPPMPLDNPDWPTWAMGWDECAVDMEHGVNLNPDTGERLDP